METATIVLPAAYAIVPSSLIGVLSSISINMNRGATIFGMKRFSIFTIGTCASVFLSTCILYKCRRAFPKRFRERICATLLMINLISISTCISLLASRTCTSTVIELGKLCVENVGTIANLFFNYYYCQIIIITSLMRL